MNAKTKTILTDVAAYLRMSSDKQDTSLADQRQAIVEYAAKRGYRIVKWYQDEGISGWKNKERHGFHALITDAGVGAFKAVLCWDQSRFSRFDPMEANHFWYLLRLAGVFIETVKEGRLDFETLGGWLTASVHQHAKAEYCKSLAHDVVRGRRAAILAGRWSWPAPYGYKIENGVLALGDAIAVETVRRIFTLRAAGLGTRRIVLQLNDSRIPGPYGGKWNESQVGKMLKRQTYLGHMVFGVERSGKFCHIMEEPTTIENSHPAIIDQDLWRKVQAINDQRGAKVKKGRKPITGGHLGGLLRCSRCDQILYANSVDQRYVCGTYTNAGGCSHNWIPFSKALSLVAEKVRELVLMGSVDKLTAHVERQLAKRKAAKVGIDVAGIKKQIAEIDRKLEGAAERLLEVEPSLVKSVRAAMLGLQEKRAALAERLTTIHAEKKQKSAREIAAGLWELDKVLREGDPDKVRAALAPYIDKVVIEFTPRPMVKTPTRTRYIATAATLYFCPESEMYSSKRSLIP